MDRVEAICRAVCKVEGIDPDENRFGDLSDANWTRYADAVASVLFAGRREITIEQEMVRQDAATAWDKCEERRQNEERFTALIAELLDDPLIMEGAPPGIGWFDRAEAAIGRPAGSSFQKALAQKRQELSEIARASYSLSSNHNNGEK